MIISDSARISNLLAFELFSNRYILKNIHGIFKDFNTWHGNIYGCTEPLHVYNEEVAGQVFAVARPFLYDAQRFLQTLQLRLKQNA